MFIRLNDLRQINYNSGNMKKVFASLIFSAVALCMLCGCNAADKFPAKIPSEGGGQEAGRFPIGSVNELINMDELIDFHFNGEKYPAKFVLEELEGYGRVLDSASSAEQARQIVKEQFTNGSYEVTENTVNAETELFYGLHAKWTSTDGKNYSYEEDVVCFKKQVYDYQTGRFFIKDEQKIKSILDYIYYSKTYNVGGYKVYSSDISKKDGKIEYVIYLLEVCYGDWGLQDSLTFVKEVREIDESGNTTCTRSVVGWAMVDGKNTHGGKII